MPAASYEQAHIGIARSTSRRTTLEVYLDDTEVDYRRGSQTKPTPILLPSGLSIKFGEWPVSCPVLPLPPSTIDITLSAIGLLDGTRVGVSLLVSNGANR